MSTHEPYSFAVPGSSEPALCQVFGAVLTREALREALYEIAVHGRAMLLVTQPATMTGDNLSPRGIAQIGVVKDYFAPKPGSDDAKP